jgi:hypothetical protein
VWAGAAVLLGFAWAEVARGGQGFDVPGRGAVLRAGAITRVRWMRPFPTDENVREMELVLSLDGGRTFGVRVTGEVEPDVSELDWRVPSLATGNARLALRVGSGTRESERIVVISDEFEIQSEPDEPEEPVLQVEMERRTREALTVRKEALPAASSVGSEPSLSAPFNEQSLAPPTRVRSLAPPEVPAGHTPPTSSVPPRPLWTGGEPVGRAPLPLRL